MKEQYRLTKELMLTKKDLIEELGLLLLEKETINLPDIISVLGPRPGGMNETMEEYLVELNERKEKEDALKQQEEEDDQSDAEEEEAAETPADTKETPKDKWSQLYY